MIYKVKRLTAGVYTMTDHTSIALDYELYSMENAIKYGTEEMQQFIRDGGYLKGVLVVETEGYEEPKVYNNFKQARADIENNAEETHNARREEQEQLDRDSDRDW